MTDHDAYGDVPTGEGHRPPSYADLVGVDYVTEQQITNKEEKRMNNRTSGEITKIAAALAKAAAKIENPEKNAVNPHFKNRYADLAAIMSSVRPILAENGIAVIQSPDCDSENGCAIVTTTLMHSSGEWIENVCRVPLSKRDAQGLGSAITYGRRYAISALLGIAAEDDDDGNQAAKGGAPAAAKRNEPPKPTIDTSSWPPSGGVDEFPHEVVQTMESLMPAKGENYRPITVKQAARLHAIKGANGWDADTIKQILLHFDIVDDEGNPTSKKIPASIYEAFCLGLETYQKLGA